MSGELESYRDNLDRLNELFPDRELLTQKDIAVFAGVTRQTAAKEFPFEGKYIPKVNFARLLARMGGAV